MLKMTIEEQIEHINKLIEFNIDWEMETVTNSNRIFIRFSAPALKFINYLFIKLPLSELNHKDNKVIWNTVLWFKCMNLIDKTQYDFSTDPQVIEKLVLLYKKIINNLLLGE